MADLGRLVFDADLQPLRGAKIAVIGYGNQGRAQALILREAGLDVVVGNLRDSYWEKASREGFEVLSVEEASRKADLISILIPDEVAPEVFEASVMPEIRGRSVVINFASGYNIAFGLIRPPEKADVIMVAPRMVGEAILDLHRRGLGYPVLLGVAQNASGRAWDYAKALAKGIGALGRPGGVGVLSSFEEEALIDLLTENTLAPMILAAIEAFFDIVTQRYGVSPEAAILELYASGELGELGRAMAERGLFEQLKLQSRTSQYAQLTRIPVFRRILTPLIEREAERIYRGEFAREWGLERLSGFPVFTRSWAILESSRLAREEDRLYKILGRRSKRS